MEEHINEINFFWIGDKISPTEQLAFASCIANQMTPVLWCYNDIDGVANYVVKKNARTIMTDELLYYYQHKLKLPLPNISDIFRYQLLDAFGGIYADTDIVFLKNIHELALNEYFCSTYEYNFGVCANGCLMKLQANTATSKYLRDEVMLRIENYANGTIKSLHYCDLGPFLVQQCARDLQTNVLPYDNINPISWRWTNKIIAFERLDYKFLIKNTIRKILGFKLETRGYFLTKQTYAIHLCNEMWKQYHINPLAKMHNASLVQKLKIKYRAYLP